MLETALALAETQKQFPALILSSPEFHEGYKRHCCYPFGGTFLQAGADTQRA